MKSTPARSPISLRLVFAAACIGLTTGTVASLFRLGLENLHHGRGELAHHLHNWGVLGWGIFVLGAIIMSGS